MEEALRNKLLAILAVYDLVGDRITWNIRPQGSSLPAVLLHLIDTTPADDADGNSGLSESRVQVDCLGATYREAKLLARAVQTLGVELTINQAEFTGVYVDAERDDHTDSSAAGSVHRTTVDLLLWHDN